MDKQINSKFSRQLNNISTDADVPDHMVFWQLNDLCNFRCLYCFCGEEKLSREHPDVGKYSPEHIARCFNRTGKTWQVHMSGGEPFLYPDYVGLCAELTRNHYISINTNLSTSNVKEFADTIDPRKVIFINAGLHIGEREKTEDGVELFIDRVKYLQEKKFNIDVGYLAYPPLFPRMEKDIDRLRSGGIRLVNAKTFRGFYKGKTYPAAYTPAEKKLVDQYALDPREEEVLNRKVNFFGRLCATGCKYFRMDPSGGIFRCSTSMKKYGNLFEEKYSLDWVPRPCPLLNCDCPYEGFKYVQNGGTSTAPAVITEVATELGSLPARGITLKKILRFIRKRTGL